LTFDNFAPDFIISIKDGKDAADIVVQNPDKLIDVVASAQVALDFFINIAKKEYDVTTPHGKREAIESILELILVIVHPIEKEAWIKRCAEAFNTTTILINKALDEGKLVIFDIDVQGFEQVNQILKDITTNVFITTPSLMELENRLNGRGTDNSEIIAKRINNAQKEIEYIKQYDYLIINDDLQIASKQLTSIAIGALLKTSLFDTKGIIDTWKFKNRDM